MVRKRRGLERSGVYPESISSQVSPERLRRFFVKIDAGYRVSTNIRERCVFSHQDVTRDPPFSKMDLVLCRNLLIYLGAGPQKKMISVFHYALNAVGFLILGRSETIGAYADLFAPLDGRARIYRRKPGGQFISRHGTSHRSALRFPVNWPLQRANLPGVAGGGRPDAAIDTRQLLLDRFAPPTMVLDEDFRLVRTYGQRNVVMETRLIDDLLDVTRIVRGQMSVELRPTDIHQVAWEATEILGEEVAKKGQSIHLELRAERHWANADPIRMRQVFLNLLRNAVKFTPNGGDIYVTSWNANSRLTIEVEDSGAGIAPEVRARLFDETVAAEVAPAPVRENAAAGVPMPDLAADDAKPKPRILLVDDHPDTLEAMTELIREMGFEVEPARSVCSALATDMGRVDLIVSDIGLPDGTGLDLMRELRANGRRRPAIAISGFGRESDVRASKEAGFDLHLTKPVDFEVLFDAIRTLNGGRPARAGGRP